LKYVIRERMTSTLYRVLTLTRFISHHALRSSTRDRQPTFYRSSDTALSSCIVCNMRNEILIESEPPQNTTFSVLNQVKE